MKRWTQLDYSVKKSFWEQRGHFLVTLLKVISKKYLSKQDGPSYISSEILWAQYCVGLIPWFLEVNPGRCGNKVPDSNVHFLPKIVLTRTTWQLYAWKTILKLLHMVKMFQDPKPAGKTQTLVNNCPPRILLLKNKVSLVRMIWNSKRAKGRKRRKENSLFPRWNSRTPQWLHQHIKLPMCWKVNRGYECPCLGQWDLYNQQQQNLSKLQRAVPNSRRLSIHLGHQQIVFTGTADPFSLRLQ